MAAASKRAFAWAPVLLAGFLSAAPAATGTAVPEPARAEPESLAFSVSVFASGARIPAPVAFSIDDAGVVYTANALRMGGHGVFDVRMDRGILAEDWALTSVAGRHDALKRWVRAGLLDHGDSRLTLTDLTARSEQIRRYVDLEADGIADEMSVFAAGMNELERGPAAGVLAWGRQVYATAIPELLAWRDSSGHALKRRVLHSGFGIHVGQGGHDLHGLTMGLDGRLYWSIGDRGFSCVTREGRRIAAHEGAVLRCWPDGGGLELFARGLRNPQELAFDDQGDLFTADNNADVGDRTRWLYLPEGANAGWSYFLQFTPSCGVWLREHHSEPAFAPDDLAQPAWVLHPIAPAGSCPAGLSAYPGTGLPARYDGTLWLADFLGGVDAYRFEPEGAGFRLAATLPGFHRSWGTCDVDWSPDGRLFVLYWGESWMPSDHARLLALTPEERSDAQVASQVRTRLARGFREMDRDSLVALLAHPDRRLRQRASFELARREDVEALTQVLATNPDARAQRHALWALGIVGHARGAERVRAAVATALEAREPETRRVSAIVLGELGDTSATPALAERLADASPRVRFAAAQALARVGDTRARGAVEAELVRNADRDPLLRSACARALVRCADSTRFTELAHHPERALRLAAVLALREAGSGQVAEFLDDADPQVAVEAARAAYDGGVPGARRALASRLARAPPALRVEPWLRRALNAALREGQPADARAVAAFAADATTSEEWREEALRVLAQWDAPDPREGVWGRWEPVLPRPKGLARDAVAAALEIVFAQSRGEALLLAVRLAEHEKIPVATRTLLGWVKDASLDDALRVEALGWLETRRARELGPAVEAGLHSSSDTLFATALRMLRARDARRALEQVERTLATPTVSIRVRQAAIRALAEWSEPEAQARLAALWGERRAGTLDERLALEVDQAARGAADAALRREAEDDAAARAQRGALARFAALLRGGDADRGRRVFEEHAAAACLRCHTLDGRGGTSGPDLSVIGTHSRSELLGSLVEPAAQLAPGYEATTMPPMAGVLTARELRDLVEYLTTRRDVVPDAYLGGLAAEQVVSRRDCLAVDRTCSGGRLRVAGHEFAHGVGTIAPARLVYAVPAGSRAFVGLAALDDASRSGQVEFAVRVDGREVWRSGPVRSGRSIRVYLDLPPDAARLELRARDTGYGAIHSGVSWLEAGFLRK